LTGKGRRGCISRSAPLNGTAPQQQRGSDETSLRHGHCIHYACRLRRFQLIEIQQGVYLENPWDKNNFKFDYYYISNKSYSLTNPAQSCGPSEECAAVAFSGSYSREKNFGFAVNNNHAAGDFSVKIYFTYTGDLPTGTAIERDADSCNVRILYNGRNYTQPDSALSLTIVSIATDEDPTDENKSNELYTIQFNQAITVISPDPDDTGPLLEDTRTFFSAGDTVVARKF
jgi:hypothetical protein